MSKIICPSCKKNINVFDTNKLNTQPNGTNVFYIKCDNCNEKIFLYIDENKKEYIGHKEYYKAFPEEYDLKKYVNFLTQRISCIENKCKDFINNNSNISKEIEKLLYDCIKCCEWRKLDIYDFLQELIDDMDNEKYDIIINKK